MSNNKLINTLITIFLFFAIIGGTGCGGGHSSSVNTCTITFDSNGGSQVASQSVNYGETAVEPEAPVKENFIFDSWYKDNDTFNELFVFGADGEKITQDITLYAQWLENNPDLFRIRYALSEVVLGYKLGDNADHVTENLVLPTKIEVSGDVNILWSSSKPEIISSTGSVTRPQGSASQVILTATASIGDETQSKSFDVRVIPIIPYSGSNNVEVIELPDLENKEVSLDYDTSGDYVNYINGKFSELTIKTPEDALNVIQSLHKILGIANTYEELQLKNSESNEYFTCYSFAQVYNGIKVYSRKITLQTNSNNEADSLTSSFLASDILKKADLTSSLTQLQAENIVKENYSDDCKIDSSLTEEVIFSLDDYKNNPVRAWVVRVSGTKKDGSTGTEDIFINASNGEIIHRTENISYMTTTNGANELGQIVSFEFEQE